LYLIAYKYINVTYTFFTDYLYQVTHNLSSTVTDPNELHCSTARINKQFEKTVFGSGYVILQIMTRDCSPGDRYSLFTLLHSTDAENSLYHPEGNNIILFSLRRFVFRSVRFRFNSAINLRTKLYRNVHQMRETHTHTYNTTHAHFRNNDNTMPKPIVRVFLSLSVSLYRLHV